ncbi:MAG: hypothetical protein SGPRY_010065, partial [Prymnesium sp.]
NLCDFIAGDDQSEFSDSLSVTTAHGWPRLVYDTCPETIVRDDWARRVAMNRPLLPEAEPVRASFDPPGLSSSYRDAVLIRRRGNCVEESATRSCSTAREKQHLGPSDTALTLALHRGQSARKSKGVEVVNGRLLLTPRRAPALRGRHALETIIDHAEEGRFSFDEEFNVYP